MMFIAAETGGKPFFPAIQASVRESHPKGNWKVTKEEPSTWRRSIYAYVGRGLRFPMFEVFDQPDPNVTSEKRNVSTVPTQALTLLNNEFVLLQSKRLAERIIREAGRDPVQQIKHLHRIALSREPTQLEMDLYRAFLEKHLSVRVLTEQDLEDANLHGARVLVLPNVACTPSESASYPAKSPQQLT